MSMRAFFAGGAALAVLASIGSTPASADYFAFGYSGGASVGLVTDSQTLSTNLFQGWFSQGNGFGNSAGPGGNTNYFTGATSGTYLNNFFVFDISSASQTAAAKLNIYSYVITDNLTYTLYDVSTPVALLNNGISPDAAIYADLGSGVSYGSFSLTSGQSNTYLYLNLNGAGVAALDAAIANGDQYFAIGGTVNTVSTPEPSTWVMLGLGFAGLAFAGYRARRSAAVAA